MTHTMVVGTSESQDFQITDDGENLVGTGLTVGIEFRPTTTNGAALSAAQIAALALVTVAWLTQASGTVRVTGIATLPIGYYYFRWTLTDSGSKKGYVPNLTADAHAWRVVKV